MFPTALIAVMLAVFLQYFGMRLLPAVLNILCLHLFLAVMMLGCGGVFVDYGTGFNYALLPAFAARSLTMDRTRLPFGPFRAGPHPGPDAGTEPAARHHLHRGRAVAVHYPP